ncbi:MAG: hypothetical protein ABI130_06230 [Leifsonia sp.]
MDAEPAFTEIAAELVGAGVVSAKMFGHPALKLNGKVFACEFSGAMAFRLGRDTPAHAEALSLPGASLFDPSSRDKPFQDWVEVPPTGADQWPALAQAALDHLVG